MAHRAHDTILIPHSTTALCSMIDVILKSKVTLKSKITCPNCGFSTVEDIPADACQFFYECFGCGVRLRPKPGDCCVFCSYGSVPCPPIQTARGKRSSTEGCCSSDPATFKKSI